MIIWLYSDDISGSTEVRIHVLSYSSGYYIVLMITSNTILCIWKYLYSVSLNNHYQQVDSNYKFAYG